MVNKENEYKSGFPELRNRTEDIKKICIKCNKKFIVTIPFRQCGTIGPGSIEKRPMKCNECKEAEKNRIIKSK